MKHLFASLALAVSAAGAAQALPPIGPQPIIGARVFQECRIDVRGPEVVALVASSAGTSWTFSVRAPGFEADQAGPLRGDSMGLRPVSTMNLSNNRPAPGRYERVMPDLEDVPRPLRAELRVRSADGSVTCTDQIDLKPSRRPMPRWMRN